MGLNAYDEIYEEYIDNILSISSLSDKEHYIFYNFNIKEDIVYDDEGVGTFRMITDNMDIFTICGLSKNQNEELLDMIDYKNCSEVKPEIKNDIIIDNTGKVNYLLVVFFIIVLVLFIITLIILL